LVLLLESVHIFLRGGVKLRPAGRDLTEATLAELRFNSIATRLPEDEGSALRARLLVRDQA
jgi:hypothetical protein